MIFFDIYNVESLNLRKQMLLRSFDFFFLLYIFHDYRRMMQVNPTLGSIHLSNLRILATHPPKTPLCPVLTIVLIQILQNNSLQPFVP